MRAIPFLSLPILLASAAAAEVIPVSSQVTAVTMYPDMAEVTRRAPLDLPAGRHQLVLQRVPDTALLDSLQVQISGARRVSTMMREDYVPPRNGTDPAVEAAEARVREVASRIAAVRDDAERARATAKAAGVSIGFLQQLGANEGLAGSDADTLRSIARMIAGEAAAAEKAAISAAADARRIELQLEVLEDELAQAEQALAALALEDADRVYIAIEVDVPEAGSGELVLNYLTEGDYSTGWRPAYEMHLNTGAGTAEDAAVTLKRGVLLAQDTGEHWQDVALTLSSAQLGEQSSPSGLWPRLRRIEEPAPPPALDMKLERQNYSGLAEPVAESPAVAESSGPDWVADSEGAAVTYVFAEPVTVASGADILRLEMDSLTAPAEMTATAVPMRDDVAYRMVRFTNEFGEKLLPSGGVPRFVDGKLIAVEDFAGLAPGAEAETGFGAIEGLQVRRDVLGQSEGGQGVISRSSQRRQQVEIEVENLTGSNWPLRVLDRVPYSEQEDLEISWRAEPAPSQEDVEKQRGILAWDMEIAAGETQQIRIETTLSWPEGMVLR